MCRKLNIEDVEIVECEEEIIADACYMSDDHARIRVGKMLFNLANKIEPSIAYAGIKTVLAHEMVHLVYYDQDNMKKNVRTIVVLVSTFIYFTLLILAYIFLKLGMWEAGFFIMIMETVYLLMSKIYTDKRYWIQIQELRADKIGSAISGVSWEQMKQFYVLLWDTEKEETEDKILMYYQKYFRIDAYPAYKRRMKVMENPRKWGIFYYIWLAIEIRKGLWKRQGWYGEG